MPSFINTTNHDLIVGYIWEWRFYKWSGRVYKGKNLQSKHRTFPLPTPDICKFKFWERLFLKSAFLIVIDDKNAKCIVVSIIYLPLNKDNVLYEIRNGNTGEPGAFLKETIQAYWHEYNSKAGPDSIVANI